LRSKNKQPLTHAKEAELAKNEIAAKNIELEKANLELIEKAKTDNDIQLAQRVQASTIPISFPEPKGITITHWYQAALGIGGDFIDGIKLDNERTLIVVGDIVGKGIQASLRMATFYPLFRLLSESFEDLPDLVHKCSRYVLQYSHVTKYIPCIIGIIDSSTSTFTYCNAGHEIGYLLRGKEAIPLDTGGPPFGADLEPEYSVAAIKLKKGDRIVFYTDGFTDLKNPDGHRLEQIRLLPIIQELHNNEPETFIEILAEKLMQYKEHAPQADDMAIISIKVSEKDWVEIDSTHLG